MDSYDLHTHTTFSDGTTTPEDNARLARDARLYGLAITDHDTTAHLAAGAAACVAAGLDYVPGIELSAEVDDRSVHVLGYWIDPADPVLTAELTRLHGERDRRARVMVERLAAAGMAVTWEQVAALAGDAPVGRPHIAQAMVDAGAVPDVTAAFGTWLHDGGPVYEPKQALAPERAVGLIVGAGGVAVLAHPALGDRMATIDEALLDRMTEAGLAAVEAHHPAHAADAAAHWQALAAARALLTTGGSDYHGTRKSFRIGDVRTPAHTVEALLERRGR